MMTYFLYTLAADVIEQNSNSYLCNKLGNVIFFRTRHGIFDRDVSRDQKHAGIFAISNTATRYVYRM
jgi:hypothetical protein